MPTEKVINMTARSSSSLNYNDFLYLTKEAPLTDEKVQASVVRDYVLSGVKTSANSGLAQTSSAYASDNPEYELSLDVNNLAIVTPVAGDYISIEDITDNTTKKVLVSAVVGLASGTVTSVTGGTNLTASPTTGATIVNLDATLTGLTSVTSTDFVGDLTGDVTGNADTATALETARTIGGTSFDGTAAIVPATITVADTSDTTAYVGLWDSATGDLGPKTDTGITYNAGTGMLTATGFTGPLTGNADTATALAGTLGVTGGGTGLTTVAKGSVLAANAADTISAVSGVTNGHVLTYTSSTDTVGWAAPGHITTIEGTSVLSTSETGTAKFLRVDGDNSCSWQVPPDTDTTYTAGPGIDLTGTKFSVEVTSNGGLEFSGAGDSGTLQIAQGISQYDVAQFTTGVVDDDFLRVDGTVVEGRSASEVLTDIAASPVAGSSSIVTVGTISSGTWTGTAIDGAYIDLEGTEVKSTGETGGTKFLREDGDNSCSWQPVPAAGVTAGFSIAMAVAL